jgi:hypothetical protein
LSYSLTNTQINHGGAVDEQIFEDECKDKPDNVEGGVAQDKAQELPKKATVMTLRDKRMWKVHQGNSDAKLAREFSLRQGETSADLQVESRKGVREKKG